MGREHPLCPGGGTEQREEGGNHQSSEGHNCSRNAAVVSRLGRGAKVGGQSSAGGHRAAPAPVQPPPQGSPRPRAAPRWGTVGRSPSVGRAWKRNEPEGESAAVLSVVGPSPVSGGGSQLLGVRGDGRAHSSSAATAGQQSWRWTDGRTAVCPGVESGDRRGFGGVGPGVSASSPLFVQPERR